MLIRWHDAHAEEGVSWIEPSDVSAAPYEVWTVGFMLPKSKPGHVSVAQSLTQTELYDHVVHIPLGMVQEVIVLG